jgi:SET domain-containing protein
MNGVNWSNNGDSYLPLPQELTIKPSPLHGLGLFAKEDIPANHTLGVSHVEDPRFPQGFIRTPIGAFINYSRTPNCTFQNRDDLLKLTTINKITAGEELTTDYTPWYNEKTLAKFN